MKKLFAILTAILPLAIIACSGGGNSSSGGGGIGSSGGTVQITDKTSPIYGTQVIVPSGAINSGQTVNISISYQDQLPGPIQSGVMQASKVIVLTKDTSDEFIIPVSVTIPYSDAQMQPGDIPAVFYWDTTYNEYLPLALTNLDRSNKLVTFKTVHFTNVVALFYQNIIQTIKNILTVDTGFKPEEDGFFHKNYGASFDPGGFCYGMAGYSIWYYSFKKSTSGFGLYKQYRQEDSNDPLTSSVPWVDDVIAREVIARAYESSFYSNQESVKQRLAENTLIPKDTGLLLISAMLITGHPQIFTFSNQTIDSHGNVLKGGHAVTVYRYDGNTGTFYIYDNNIPASSSNYKSLLPDGAKVQWDLNNGFHDYVPNGYGTITQFGFDAISSFRTPGSFEPIYQQAASGGWPSQVSWFKTININSPQLDANNTAIITQNQDVTVNGTLTNGLESPAVYLIYYVNGVKQTP